MFYTAEVTVPASTTETSPVTSTMKLTKGVITRAIFQPRPGHAALCHCQVRYQGHQVFPTNPEEDLHGDTFPIDWDEHIELDSEPFDLLIIAWNEDDTYAHTFDFSVAVLPYSVVQPYTFVDALKSIISALIPKRVTGGS